MNIEKLNRFWPYIILMAIFFQHPFAFAQEYQPTWESLDKKPVPEWFHQAKFGIFIHWGVYSVPSYRPIGKERYASYAEWYEVEVMGKEGEGRDFHDRVYGKNFEYRDFGPMFRAELFEPAQWAKLFKASGAKYVVLTAKHHDGYCLWPTKTTDWNSINIGPKRDLVGDLTNAVRDEGLKMGLYFSLLEWTTTPTENNPSGYYLDKKYVDRYGMPHEQYVDQKMIPQIKELVTNYQPAVIFADGTWDGDADFFKSKEALSWIYNNAPNKDELVVNDRWGKDTFKKHGGYFTSEYSEDDDNLTSSHPWEESQGVGGSYGYNRAENIGDYKTSEELIHLLINTVARGGNLLLNVGPTADGRIPVIMQQRLMDIGEWLEINGEAIFDTHPASEIKVNNDVKGVYFTKKANKVFAIFTAWPGKEVKFTVADQMKVRAATLSGYEQPLAHKQLKNVITLKMPDITPGKMESPAAYVFQLTLE